MSGVFRLVEMVQKSWNRLETFILESYELLQERKAAGKRFETAGRREFIGNHILITEQKSRPLMLSRVGRKRFGQRGRSVGPERVVRRTPMLKIVEVDRDELLCSRIETPHRRERVLEELGIVMLRSDCTLPVLVREDRDRKHMEVHERDLEDLAHLLVALGELEPSLEEHRKIFLQEQAPRILPHPPPHRFDGEDVRVESVVEHHEVDVVDPSAGIVGSGRGAEEDDLFDSRIQGLAVLASCREHDRQCRHQALVLDPGFSDAVCA